MQTKVSSILRSGVALTFGVIAMAQAALSEQACLSLPSPVAIPDNNPTGITRSMTIPALASIQDLNVSLNVTHTYVGDLKVTLRHVETGTVINLVNRMARPSSAIGTCFSNDLNVTLDDQGTGGPIHTTCGAATTSSTPSSPPSFTPEAGLSAFNGQAITGTWEVTVSDLVIVDTGTLNSACLKWNSTDVAVSTTFSAPIFSAGSLIPYQISLTNNGPYDQESNYLLDYGPGTTLLYGYSLPRGTANIQNIAGPTFGTYSFFTIPNLLVGEHLTVQMLVVTSKLHTGLGGPIPDSTILKVNSSAGGAPKEIPNFPLNFDPALHGPTVSGDMVLVDDASTAGAGGLTSDACQPLVNGAAVNGKIAVVDSYFAPLPGYAGTPPPCSYSAAQINVAAAGAKGIIFVNVTDNAYPPFAPIIAPPTGTNIPLMFVGKKFGDQLKAGGNVTISVGQVGVWEQFGQTVSSSSDDLNNVNDVSYAPLVLGNDTDNDNVPDALDYCVTDSAKSNPGVCGCGKVDVLQDVNVNSIADCNEAPSALVPPAPKIKQKKGAITVTLPNISGASYVVKFVIKAPGAKKSKKKTVTSSKNIVGLTKLSKGTSITVSYHFNLGSPSASSTLESGQVKVNLKK
ncbi:MAG: proprotein convertase P-domain-containing protein [Oligoflexia bacterium]|nr:proprotein convertase P-domain-containing protein [Oligoflexia bacterium]